MQRVAAPACRVFVLLLERSCTCRAVVPLLAERSCSFLQAVVRLRAERLCTYGGAGFLFVLRLSLRLCLKHVPDNPARCSGGAGHRAGAGDGRLRRHGRRPGPGGWHRVDQRCRRREPVRQRAEPDRRPLRARHVGAGQPQCRPAHLRGQPAGGQRGCQCPADCAERARLRHLDRQDGGRRAAPRPEGHRRPARARPAGQHAQPAPVVPPGHHAGRGPGDRRRPVGAAARPRRLLPGQPGRVRPLVPPPCCAPSPPSGRPTQAPPSPPPNRSPTTCWPRWERTTWPRSGSRPT
jgi:hypothetical protein